MGYSAESLKQWIETHYRDKGPVVRIEKGDYRKHIRHQALREASEGYTVDMAAFNRVVRELGLKWPVKLRHHARIGNTNGNYHLRKRDGRVYHDIMLKSYHDANQANSTLWHELCHALQAERSGSYESWRMYHTAQRKYPYSRRPIEVEARLFAEEHEWEQLCK
jgi:hypothetical protein